MIRIAGVLLLLLGGGLSGWIAGDRNRKKLRTLGELSAGLTLLERELELGGLPMESVMARLSDRAAGTAGELFRFCGQELKKQDRPEFSVLWEKACRLGVEAGAEAVQSLTELGGILGRWEAGEQIAAAERCRCRLEELRTEARQNSRTQNHLYQMLGLSSGAFLAILLL